MDLLYFQINYLLLLLFFHVGFWMSTLIEYWLISKPFWYCDVFLIMLKYCLLIFLKGPGVWYTYINNKNIGQTTQLYKQYFKIYI